MSIQEIRNMKSANEIMFIALFQSLHKLVIGGVITALGVCIMHYLGMMAIVIDAEIEWNIGIVIASVLIALTAATAAYWILFRLLALYPRKEILRFASAFVAALAVCGMHFTGMAAARYVYVEGKAAKLPKDVLLVDGTLCVLGSIIASIVFLFINGLITTADLRAWYYNNDHIIRNTDKIMSNMEKVGESNPVAWKAVKNFKELRPNFERSISDSWKSLNPVDSTKGGINISATPDTPEGSPVTPYSIRASRSKSVLTNSFTSIKLLSNGNRISNLSQIVAEESVNFSMSTNEG
eukprot:CAMPEP_0119049768 /NCGR_PEP_ID=MMETSP1177-20130426/66246_1 /TAXON_ID=2985 /ORGANISM="Ochromonas sp, Strain CCMP1899" /LENGTH=294 /DNA_ID=CAMNT_0007027379 /DNA_START=577 /DNA_END=1461 /DNA_ORIENTATION=-